MEENGGDSLDLSAKKKAKKIKKEEEDHDETLDQTIKEEDEENNGVENGQPKTRRDLMDLPYDTKLSFVSVIASPMANKKLGKKLFKLMRKAGKLSRKTLLRIGLKDVQLRIRKGKVSVKRSLIFFIYNLHPFFQVNAVLWSLPVT